MDVVLARSCRGVLLAEGSRFGVKGFNRLRRSFDK